MKYKCRFKLNKSNCTYWPEFRATCPEECPNSIIPQNLPKANAYSLLAEVRSMKRVCGINDALDIGYNQAIDDILEKIGEHFI